MAGKAFLSSWLHVLTRPYTPVFRDELARKSNLRTLIHVAVAAVLGIGLSWLAHLLFGRPAREFMGLASVWVPAGTQPPFSSWAAVVPAGVILGFYDFQIVLFIFARLLGGRGSFGAQAYLQSLFYAPLAVVQQVFSVTPVVGLPLFALLAVCSLLPTTTSLKAAHGYSTRRAVATWLLPILLNILVVFVVVMILTARAARQA